jgi:hypothetical protein
MDVIDWVIAFVMAVFIGAMFLIFMAGSSTPSTKLTKQELISMCNTRGGIYAEGTCQRVYLNLCRRL